MIKAELAAPDYDVVPQAIFWRPIRYFTNVIREDQDDLDTYEAAAFALGNVARFDLRAYRGHPKFTVTLYLPFSFEDVEEIRSIVQRVVAEMELPQHAIAWQRGQDYTFGRLERSSEDRIQEKEARILVLKIAARCHDRTATMEYIKNAIPNYVALSDVDRQRSESRDEERWRQIVGNVVSHAATAQGPFAMGYAVKSDDGITVTDRGLDYLGGMGFSI